MSSSSKVRVGLVGCGAFGLVHTKRLAAEPRAELAVFCDPNPASAAKLRDQFAPKAAVAENIQDCFNDGGLDAVVLCSPTALHYEQVCAALDRGLHVLCEKPLTLKREQILDLIHRRKETGKNLSISYQRRYEGLYTTARRELAEKADWYGPLQEVHVFVCERWEQTIGGTWRDDPATNAGYIGDAGSHQIDACGFISGKDPLEVFAQGHKSKSRVEIVTRVLATLEDDVGFVGHFVGNASHWREDLHFHCRDADLLIRDNKLFRSKENLLEEIPMAERLADSNPDRGLLDGILQGVATPSPPECALPIFDWTAAIVTSVRESRTVRLPASAR